MGNYHDSLDTESESANVMQRLSVIGGWTCKPITDKAEQMELGDYVCDGHYVECKAEKKFTGNLFVETWSNYPSNRGWGYKLGKREYLFYMFLGKICYVLRVKALGEWIQHHDSLPTQKQCHEVQQGQCHQKNDTRGYLVPIEELKGKGIIFAEIDLARLG